MSNATIEWEDASAKSYTADQTTVNGHIVTVCLDDEGPMNPAFYWEIDHGKMTGWASSVEMAKAEAVLQALTWQS